jgi:UDP-N-acetylmuramoyl-tripeptide--D-alanyl-D-alanine ligase
MMNTEALYLIYQKHPLVFTDSRKAADGGIFFALKGERFDGNDYALQALADGAHCAVVDRLDLSDCEGCFYVNDVLKALQKLANHHRKQLNIPVLAITGTNGKTTTKELIAKVLSEKFKVLATAGNLNNHIGVPLTLLSISLVHDIAVIEMGANHPGEIQFLCEIAEPDYGIITNVGKAHLEGFGSFEGVKQTKSEMYRYIARYGKGIFINICNEHLVPLAKDNLIQYSYAIGNNRADLYGEPAGDDLFVVARVFFEKGWLYLKSKLTGNFNLENIMAAARIGLFFGLDPLQIQKGIEGYLPSNNRSQILQKGSSTILLDCYNANPSSMSLSVQHFIQLKRTAKLMVLGDMLELGDVAQAEHQKVVDMISENYHDEVILVGKLFMETNAPEHYHRFFNVEEMKGLLDFSLFTDRSILIKGSRGIGLEKILDWI